MPSESGTPNKDGLGRFHLLSQASIPWIALVFTVVFGWMELKNQAATRQLTTSNIKLARSQVKVSLIPLLTSKEPGKRAIALYLSEQLDEQFAADAASVLSISDPDKDVRRGARSVLESLSQSRKTEVRQRAEKAVDQYDIMNELRTKGLLKKLQDAQDYIDGGSPNGDEEALKLYHQVIEQLSPAGLKKLDPKILISAHKDEEEGYLDQAARKYRALFGNYKQIH